MPAAVASSISGINLLSQAEQERTYGALIPAHVLEQFQIDTAHFTDAHGRKLLELHSSPGSITIEITLRHEYDALIYFHLSDTHSNRIIILLSVVNDPQAPRFDVDRMPDGTRTNFGFFKRNVVTEVAALQAGLAPGQIRRGLRVLRDILATFEVFIGEHGHDMYCIEPLFYHNAIILERYGFPYHQGKRWMQNINTRFSDNSSPLIARLDGSTPFRTPQAAQSVRGRSWKIHDDIFGKPFTNVHMQKRVGKNAALETFPGGVWQSIQVTGTLYKYLTIKML